MTNTISAAANPDLANELFRTSMASDEERLITVPNPPDTSVTLPGGYIDSSGRVVTDAEVRELTGKDEEAISRATNLGKAVLLILQRGVVSVGGRPVDDRLLEELLGGDRDMLLLAIFKATFGKTTEVPAFCSGCNEEKTVSIDLDEDIPVKKLGDPVGDRVFTYHGKTYEITVQLPTGYAQKELLLNSDKTVAELKTILLENTIKLIGKAPVMSKAQVQDLSIVERQEIAEEIDKRVPGPQFEDLTVSCPDCGSDVRVSFNFGALFQL